MRMTQPTNVRLIDSSLSSSTLAFEGERGERFQVSVLDDDLIRVQMFPMGSRVFKKRGQWLGRRAMSHTKAVCETTYHRFHCRPFECAAQDGLLLLQTRQLAIRNYNW
jgi:hypothetical protein